jgi:hypothetical protein
MQNKKSMTNTDMFIYVLIIFLFTFLDELSAYQQSMSLFTSFTNYHIHNIIKPLCNIPFFLFDNAANIPCKFDKDCPAIVRFIWRCQEKYCE